MPDLYTLWLKVPATPRPLDHYTLLGVPRFCENPEQIEAATQTQLERLDRYSLLPDIARREKCHQMMSEVARARLVLMDEKKRAAYDQTLGKTATPGISQLEIAVAETNKSAYAASVPTSPLPTGLFARMMQLLADQPVLWIVPLAFVVVVVACAFLFAPKPPPANPDVAINPPSPQVVVTPTEQTAPSVPTQKPLVPVDPKPVAPKPAPALIVDPKPVQVVEPPRPVDPPPAVALTADPTQGTDQLPIPIATAREKSNKLIDEVFADQIASASNPDQKNALAERWIVEAERTNDNPSDRYVLLKRAGDLAVDAGNIQTAIIAIDLAAKKYQFDALRTRSRAIEAIASDLEAASPHKTLREQSDKVIADAIAAKRYDVAKSSIAVAVKAANIVKDQDWLNQSNSRLQEVNFLESNAK